ncbi:MAG TPA: GTP cyclohydrolase II [Stellaceae bacterium]|nr:GTP cyclohydrolase II [Stellaceae bacterium]
MSQRSFQQRQAPLPAEPSALVAIDRAITELRRGGFVVLRAPDAALLLLAAEAVTDVALADLARLAGAKPALAITRRRAAVLGLVDAPMGPGGSVLLAVPEGADAAALRDLADPGAPVPAIPPLAPLDGTVRAAADAAVELVKLARLLPAAVVVPLTRAAAQRLTGAATVLAVESAQVLDYQASAARSLRPVSEARVPLKDAEQTRIIAFRPSDGGLEHLAILIGEPDPATPVLTRLHSECFTGDLLGSLRCDCGDQLRGAITEIARAGGGVLLYLAQEGRGIGLVNKLRAYELQDAGFDTVDANEQLGFDADERVYLPAAEMLRQLGFTRVRLLTNNPEKMAALTRCGIQVVERVPHVFPANGHNERYLKTKAARSGHLL